MKQTFSATPEQQEVIETWGKGLAVLAGAGCGKTTTLVRKCERLLREKPDSRVIAVSFTERSASDLREKLATVIRVEGLGHIENHWVMTIHALCSRIAREFPGPAGLDGEERVLDEVESQAMLRKVFESLWYLEVPDEIEKTLTELMAVYSRDWLEGEVLRMIEIAHFGAIERLESVSSGQPLTRSLANLSRFVIERYSALKRREGALDFNDLESAALQVLQSPEAAQSLRSRFDLVLVDEFQDTNPIQCEIVRQLARVDYSNLVVVGDPKQSIYRFRDADVTLFEEFCALMPMQVKLTRNYRSDAELIDFTNHVCAPIFSDRKMTYEPLVPTRETKQAGPRITWIESDRPRPLAEHILGLVHAGAKFGDFAILLQRVRGNEKLLDELLSSGIPIALGSGGLFWSEPRIIEIVSLLRAYFQPENQLSAAIALRAPWIGVDDALLDAWATEPKGFLIERFIQESDHEVARYLRSISHPMLRPGEVLKGLANLDSVADEIGFCALALWHRLESMSSLGWAAAEVLDECQRAIDTGKRDSIAPPPASLGQVTVLTIHSSKGLEFDRVILPDLEKKRFQSSPSIYWDNRRGIYVAGRDGTGARAKDSVEEESWKSFEREKALDENLRLFYVALTRARNELIFYAKPDLHDEADAKPAKKKKETLPSEQLNWKLWLKSSGHPYTQPRSELGDSVFESIGFTEKTEEVDHRHARDVFWKIGNAGEMTKAKRRPRHSVTELLALKGCEKAYHYRVIDPVLAFEVPSESGADIGTEVHFALSQDRYEEVDRLVPGSRFSEYMKTDPVPMKQADRSIQLEVFRELPFEFVLSGEAVVGVIDRLGVSPDRIDLVDFKVTQGTAEPDDLKNRYFRQMKWYAFAVERFLPGASDRLVATLIQISRSGVREVEVFKGRQSFDELSADLNRALALIDGGQPVANPGSACRFCSYRSVCSDRAS